MSEFRELSRAAYEAIVKDDVDAFVELTDKKVKFDSLVEGRSYKGHKGVREWWGNVINALGGVGIELKEVNDFGDHGYVKMATKSNPSDVEMPTEIFQAMRVKKGKAVWWGVFATEDEARQGLGIK